MNEEQPDSPQLPDLETDTSSPHTEASADDPVELLPAEEPLGELPREDVALADAASGFPASIPVSVPHRRVPPPGPGIWEALAWTFVLVPVQLAGMLLAILVVKFDDIRAHGAAALKSVSITELAGSPATLACIQVTMICFAVGAAFLRLGGLRTFRRLGEWTISPRHLFIIASSLLPVALFCGSLQQWAMHGWTQLLERIGVSPDELPKVDALQGFLDATPIWALFLLIGAVPAIAEELIFRGIIGRGLVARRGVVSGVLLTSLLFAMVHLHPAQAVGLLPLAVFMHVAYLATRSFLAPMLIHFLNNSFAVLVFASGIEGAEAEGLPPAAAAVAFVVLVLAIALLWQTRVHYCWIDGGLCTPGYTTVEPPRPDAPVVRLSAPTDVRLAWGFAVAVVSLFSVLGFLSAQHAGKH